MSAAPNVYDVVTYPAIAYRDTHPSRLATMAILHGLQPADVERCRVLEIGCNSGANLIPMAYALPRSEFVGFDLAAAPVARARQTIQELGLRNIHILQTDLMDAENIPELSGRFDYIIAHGVYAWVPARVRDRLLGFCREHLRDQGVAFISYAALPGGYVRLLTRDIGLLGEVTADNQAAGVRQSMDLLRFIASCRPEGDAFRVLLERDLHNMEKRGPEVVFHDEGAEFYKPVSFREFTEHAAGHGLRYFSEAELPGPKDPSFQQETAAAMQALAGGDPLVQEQILDFARMRMYRESLLCREEASFTFDLQMNGLTRLFLTSEAKSLEGGGGPGSRAYTSPEGIQIETQNPETIAVLEFLLATAPEAVSFQQLSAHLEQHGLPAGPALPVLILRLVVSRMVRLDAWQAPVTRQVADRPLASRLCREQAAQQERVVTPLHSVLDVADPIVRRLVQLLDGTRNREELLRDLSLALPEAPPKSLADGIGPALELLARTGVLERPTA